VPDVEVELRRDALLAGRDTALDVALAWIEEYNANREAVADNPRTGRTQ